MDTIEVTHMFMNLADSVLFDLFHGVRKMCGTPVNAMQFKYLDDNT